MEQKLYLYFIYNVKEIKMMKFWLKFFGMFFIIVFLVTAGFSQSIKVTSPNGGESWQLGSTHNITWNTSGVSGNIIIKLLKSGTMLGSIAWNIPNTGSYSWTINNISGTPIQPGNDYKVLVRSFNNHSIQDESDINFSIVKGISASISVISPNGGENWKKGSNYNVKWQSSGVSGNVIIQLLQSGSPVGEIYKGANTGSFNWIIDKYLNNNPIADGNYLLQIKSLNNPSVNDQSDNTFNISPSFKIIPPGTVKVQTINLIQPNGGEKWMEGFNKKIKWTSQGIDKIRIDLLKDSVSTSSTFVVIADNVDPTSGTYEWKVGKHISGTVKPDNDYRISLIGKDKGNNVVTQTKSNSTFTITKSNIVQIKNINVQYQPAVVQGQQVFAHNKPSIKVSQPRTGDSWSIKPWKSGYIEWVFTGIKGIGQKDQVNIKLVPVNQSQNSFTIKTNISTKVKKGNLYVGTYDWNFPKSINIQSGKFRIRIESIHYPGVYGESDIFDVNTISSGAGFLAPQKPDIILQDVFLDGVEVGYITARIKNMGNDYSGNIQVDYDLTPLIKTEEGKKAEKSSKKQSITIKNNQTKDIKLTYWDFSPSGNDYLNKHRYPKTSALKANVFIKLLNAADLNQNNNLFSGFVYKTKSYDIVVAPRFRLGSTQSSAYYKWFTKFTSNRMNGFGLKWLKEKTHEVKLMVTVYNFGVKPRAFKTYFYFGNQRGQLLDSMTLQPGQKKVIEKIVQIYTPKHPAKYKMLFVADQDEKNNQVYPNSYNNNFIIAILDFYIDNEVKGKL